MAETTGAEDKRTPFQKMQDLAVKFIAVPKEEVDRRQAEWEANNRAPRTKPMLKK